MIQQFQKWWIVGLLYILVWGLFGFLYWRKRTDFYHPYIQHEPQYVAMRAEIQRKLTEAYKKGFEIEERFGVMGTEYKIDQESIEVTSVNPRAPGLAFELTLTASMTNGSGSTRYDLPLVMDRREEDWLYSINKQWREKLPPELAKQFEKEERERGRLLMVFFEKGFEAPKPSRLFSNEVWPSVSLQALAVNLDTNLITTIDEFVESAEGNGEKIPGSFGRMLYLSGMTITTVGYGDIVPLTGLTRFLTGLEGALGIILLGLLVNSLSRVRSSSSG